MAAPTTRNINFYSDLTPYIVTLGEESFSQVTSSTSTVNKLTNWANKKYGPTTLEVTQGSFELLQMDDVGRPWNNSAYTSNALGDVEIIGGCWLRVTGFTTQTGYGPFVVRVIGSDTGIVVRHNGDLELCTGLALNQSTIVTGPNISTNTWYYVEWMITQSSTATEQFMWVDGVRYSASAATFVTVPECDRVQFGISSGNTYFEAPWIGYTTSDSGTNPSNFFTGPAVSIAKPTTDVSGSNWTGGGSSGDTTNQYNNVDEQNAVNTTQYNYSSTITNTNSHEHSIDLSVNYSGLSYSLELGAALFDVRRTTSPSAAGILTWNDPPASSNLINGNLDRDIDAAWIQRMESSHTRLDGATAWTEAALEAMRVSYYHNQAQARELRAYTATMAILVDITPSTSIPMRLVGEGGGLIGNRGGLLGNGGI